MTKKELIRRLENLALETGHKRNYYVKRALVEFLDRNAHLLANRRTHTNGFSTRDEVYCGTMNRAPTWSAPRCTWSSQSASQERLFRLQLGPTA